jgi:hypothetical protein
MKNQINIEKFKDASVKLSEALISIWDDPKIRLFSENMFEVITKESNLKKESYNINCNEPWQVILWCYCSLNTKGSSKAAKDWIKNGAFNEMSNQIRTFILTKNEYSVTNKFIALNIILRYFAGGKFLTINKSIVNDVYFKKTEELTYEKLHNKVISLNNFNFSEYEEKSTKADSWKIFQLFRQCHFDINLINVKFKNLSILTSSVKQLEELNGLSNKYSRNIKMDMRTIDSENFIAIDLRINKILKKIGLNLNINKDYNKIEDFFIKDILQNRISNKIMPNYKSRPKNIVGITPWELDRLLYNIGEDYLMDKL